jgi:hypothetical protein
MRSTRLTSLVLLAGLIVGGLVLDAADDDPTGDDIPAIEAGVAMPAATPAGTLASTWYCAGGTATDDGFADHVLLLANPTDQAKVATVTVLTGRFAPPPTVRDTAAGGTTTTAAQPTTTTTAAPTTTTEPVPEAPAPSEVELPPHSRVEVALRELVEAPLASAIVEVDGGEVAVEHQITSLEEGGGRATAACSSTAARTWTFAWGVTERGARELLVFMNPFPDDATVTIDFATDEGTRQTLRFQNFVVPGRSVVGAFVDQDVTRKSQVSAHIQAGSGRVVVDRIQTFDGTNPALEGITLGLGAPVPAEVWAFPDGIVDEGITEQIIVFNPTDEVAEVEAEVRLANPEGEVLPEPFEITVPPRRYSVVDLHEPDVEATEETPKRIPDGAEHSIIVRSLNHVPVVAERVLTKTGSSINVGVGAVLGSPLAARRWLLVAGGVNEERSEYATVLNARTDQPVNVSISRLAGGRLEPIPDLQDVPVAPGARLSVRLRAYVDADVAPLVVTATGPVVVERGLYRFRGRGISFAMGIPVAEDVFVFDPLDG